MRMNHNQFSPAGLFTKEYKMKKLALVCLFLANGFAIAGETNAKLNVSCVINGKNRTFLADGLTMGETKTYIFNIAPNGQIIKKLEISNQFCMIVVNRN